MLGKRAIDISCMSVTNLITMDKNICTWVADFVKSHPWFKVTDAGMSLIEEIYVYGVNYAGHVFKE